MTCGNLGDISTTSWLTGNTSSRTEPNIGEDTYSPYPEGSLPAEHQAQIEKIRRQIVAWRNAAKSASIRRPQEGTEISSDTREALRTETQRFAGVS